MDEATRLIDELQARLSELDDKVSAYRTEMVLEFTKYTEDQIRRLPDELGERVSRVIAESLANHPGLNPASPVSSLCSTPRQSSQIGGGGGSSGSTPRGRDSPPPILPHTSGKPKDLGRKLHKRDREFQGLFTPSYLPLLDSKDRPLHSPPAPPFAASSAAAAQGSATTNTNPASDIETAKAATTPTDLSSRPSLLRRATDTTISSVDSIASATSSTTRRKSALRRPSTPIQPLDSPRGSRRVRFEFQGAEYFPSSSPIVSKVNLAEISGPEKPFESSSAPANVEEYYISSLGDVQGEQDFAPPPKKVSSTQALRALSRSPLDTSTTWTMVNPDPDRDDTLSPAVRGLKSTHLLSPPTSIDSEVEAENLPPRIIVGAKSARSVPAQKPSFGEEDSDDSSSSEEELTMGSGRNRRMAPAPRAMPSKHSQPALQAAPSSTAAAPRPIVPMQFKKSGSATALGKLQPFVTKKVQDESSDEDDLFEFETSIKDKSLQRAVKPRHTTKHLSDDLDSASEDEESTDDGNGSRQVKETPLSLLSSSPAINIRKRSDAEGSHSSKAPRTPTSATMAMGSLGSSFRDADISRTFDDNTNVPAFFVGSLSGRSGPDSSKASSYKATIDGGSLAGRPTASYMERFALERAMEQKAAGQGRREGK